MQGNPAFIDGHRINYADYDSFEKMRMYVEEVESKAASYLRQLTPDTLSRTFDRKRRDGSVLTATVEDHLPHLFKEETHLPGELIALLWREEVKPPHVGWLQYLKRQSA